MKYSIFINQPKALEWGLNLTEAAIFSFLYELPSWAEHRIVSPGWPQYFCSKNKIIEEFPLLTNKRDTVYRLLKSLEEKDLITHEFDGGKDWIRVTAKGQTYNDWQGSEKNPINPGKKSDETTEKNPIYNTSSNTSTNIMSTGAGEPAAKITVQKKVEVPIRERKIAFLKLVIDWITENTDKKYPKLMYVDFSKYWIERSFGRKSIKLRYEDQQFFDVGRRLSTWFKKVDDRTATDYWAQEKDLPTINDLFKKLL